MSYKPQLDKVSSTDTTADFLIDKLQAGEGISITQNNAGGNETLTVAATGGGGYADDNVSNPPTEQELTTAFGAPVTVGAGFYGLLNDGGAGSREYIVFSDGENWNYVPLARCVSSLGYASLTRYGAVFTPDSGEENYFAESTVIIEDGLWKMWYRYGWTLENIGYATSPDGINWTRNGSNPILTNVAQPFVIKDGSTYLMYVSPLGAARFDLYTSADGITWTLDTATVLNHGGAGAWDSAHMGNMFVWKEGASDYRMLYEAATDWAVSDTWKIGYATSTDGRTWTKSGSNPVVTASGSVGGPFVYKYGSTYYLWAHTSPSGGLPSDIGRWHSTNLTSWTYDGLKISRTGADEGAGSSVGQVGDVHILIHNHVAYFYYEGSPDGSTGAGSTPIKLITGNEGLIWQ